MISVRFHSRYLFRAITLVGVLLLAAGVGLAQSEQKPPGTRPAAAQSSVAKSSDILHQLNDSLAMLVRSVSPAVVQILVTSYGPVAEGQRTDAAMVERQHAIGSGVVVDSDGYIMTNAHVVEGAQRVRVVLTGSAGYSAGRLTPVGKRDLFDARILGVDSDTDLALLKIDATELPSLSLARTRNIRQGQLVVALGSPEGLENSVSLGVVSSVARQPDPDKPNVFIQTDAPINPGNSGGPLIDVDGGLVGINTFILTEGGGSEGLGFAIPARIVKYVYDQLRAHGHVHRTTIGAEAQTITRSMATGLGLSRTWGVIVSDVIPGGPADEVGLKIGDIVLSVDGRNVDTLPVFESHLYLHETEQRTTLEVLRGTQKLTLQVPVIAQKHEVDRFADLADPEKNLVPKLGIIGIDLSNAVRSALPDLRSEEGVLVVARMATPGSTDAGLLPGDIVRSLNRKAIARLADMRAASDLLSPGAPVVLQIERNGVLRYLAFEME